MLDEATMIFERWFTDSVNGINAELGNVPRDPALAPPRPVAIYSDLSDEEIAGERDPTEVPALVILADEASESELKWRKSANEDPNVVIALLYVDREAPILQSRREGGIVLRAAKRICVHMNELAATDPYREMNQIRLVDIKSVSEHRVTGAVGRSTLFGFNLVLARFLDLAPR